MNTKVQKLDWQPGGYPLAAEVSWEESGRYMIVDDRYFCHYAELPDGMTAAEAVADYAAGYETEAYGSEINVTAIIFDRGTEVYRERHTFIAD